MKRGLTNAPSAGQTSSDGGLDAGVVGWRQPAARREYPGVDQDDVTCMSREATPFDDGGLCTLVDFLDRRRLATGLVVDRESTARMRSACPLRASLPDFVLPAAAYGCGGSGKTLRSSVSTSMSASCSWSDCCSWSDWPCSVRPSACSACSIR